MSNDADLSSALDDLDDDDLVRVERLIQKLAARKQAKTKDDGPVPHGPRKKKSSADLDKPQPERRIQGRRRSSRQGRVEQVGRGKGRRNKGRQARAEPLDTSGGRENGFFKLRESRSKNRDRETDQALAGDNYESIPRGERTPYVEAMCQECEDFFDVSPEFVHYDPDKGAVFTCNDCATSRRH